MEQKHFTEISSEITRTTLPEQAIALWWLGQSGFVLRDNTLTIYLDPFLSNHPARLVPAPFPAEVGPPADLVLCTHDHLDHLDLPTIQGIGQSSPHARFVVPAPSVEQVIAAGIAPDRIIGVQPDEEWQLDTARVFPLPALHGNTAPPAVYDFGFAESGGKYRYLGYVIELNGVRVYHAGDTLVYDGMVERLRKLAIDIALLPINGRGYFREQQDLVGNLDEREAADLAAAVGVKLLIPMHYDMFAANLGRPGVLVEYVRAAHSELACYLPAYGRRFVYCR
jgi:L-ascorbate metabolism protein UlaG (beta-lactamase superfamily)